MAAPQRKPRKKKKSHAVLWGVGIALLALILVGAWAAWVVLTPYGPDHEVFVELTPGSSTSYIGRQLEEAGVVRCAMIFDAVSWLRRGKLHVGLYRFAHPATVTEVQSRIARGDLYTKSVTIPEGASIFDIATRMEQAGLGSRQAFLDAAVKNVALVNDLDPEAKSLEGYLFPDTYHFAPKSTPAQIYATMVRRFRAVATQIGLKGNVHVVVTIASLVERETAVANERPLVASVFTNRLAKKMPLATDPSIIYGLMQEGNWRGVIYKSDLQQDSPWNTYKNAGLPPGPIANPGMQSLKATLAPASTNYLYFVAAGRNPQGHSLFAATLEEHNRNVADYRAAMKKAGKE